MLYTIWLHPKITPAMGRMTVSLFIVTSLKMDDCELYPSRSKRFSCSPNHPDSLWGPQSLLFNGFYQWLLQWHQSSQGMRMTTHLHQAPRLKMSGATLPSPCTSSQHVRETTFRLGYNLSTLFQLWKVYSIK